MSDNKCPQCHRVFTRHDNMLRHLNEKRCKMSFFFDSQSKQLQPSPSPSSPSSPSFLPLPNVERQIAELKAQTTKEIADLKKQKNRELAEIKEMASKELAEIKKNRVNQVLQVICVTNTDNYLDMLTERLGNFGDAIEYIKDCALSDLSGDCRLIEKIYLGADDPQIHYIDRGKTKIIFYNEKQERVVESKVSMGKKLANNLQNSYLKGINCLINRNLTQRANPNRLLEDYDLQTWNTHIYNLSDACYQKKMISQLSLPVITDIAGTDSVIK